MFWDLLYYVERPNFIGSPLLETLPQGGEGFLLSIANFQGVNILKDFSLTSTTDLYVGKFVDNDLSGVVVHTEGDIVTGPYLSKDMGQTSIFFDENTGNGWLSRPGRNSLVKYIVIHKHEAGEYILTERLYLCTSNFRVQCIVDSENITSGDIEPVPGRGYHVEEYTAGTHPVTYTLRVQYTAMTPQGGELREAEQSWTMIKFAGPSWEDASAVEIDGKTYNVLFTNNTFYQSIRDWKRYYLYTNSWQREGGMSYNAVVTLDALPPRHDVLAVYMYMRRDDALFERPELEFGSPQARKVYLELIGPQELMAGKKWYCEITKYQMNGTNDPRDENYWYKLVYTPVNRQLFTVDLDDIPQGDFTNFWNLCGLQDLASADLVLVRMGPLVGAIDLESFEAKLITTRNEITLIREGTS